MRTAAAAFVFLVGCGGDGRATVDPTTPDLERVRIAVGHEDPTVLTLAGAWLSDDGTSGHGVDAEATLAAAPPLVVKGDRSSWDFKKRTMRFEGNVQATRAAVTMTCDAIEVSYEGERITTAMASGTVVVTQGERIARGERATLTADDGRIVLQGSPSINDGPNTLVGDRIVLYLDDERLECQACRLEVVGSAVAPVRDP